MKLLIVTQKVDKTDPVLGFFHRWVEEFAKHCDRITVIGQYVGDHNLPSNVQVYSLGKESGKNRLSQILRFWSLQWTLRNQYDQVFVHMTPIWVVLGWDKWMILRKPMYLWYEARGKRWPLRIALRCVQKVFSASSGGMPLKTAKSIVTGHGIDSADFSDAQEDRQPFQLITVGRITRSKRLEKIFECMQKLPDNYSCAVFGATITEDDVHYREELEKHIDQCGLQKKVRFHEPVPQTALAVHLQRANIALHASVTALDKAVLEAMACGCIVVSTNPTVHTVLPEECRANDENFAEKVKAILAMSEEGRQKLREQLRKEVVEHHSLSKLIERLVKEMGF